MESHMIASLKRASADVVHNMSKEAAMRILVAERKALRFQQELFATKEEALNMLLRLKQTMDYKNVEMEKASLCQTRRVKELEAQLRETEHTVSDLREELKRTSDELERMKRSLMQPLDEQTLEEPTAAIHEYMCHENKLEVSDSSLSPHIIISEAKVTTLTQRPASELSTEPPDLATIIMRTKEPELCRNGCTQRIRAFEQNLLTGKVASLEKSDDQCLNAKYQSVDGVEQAFTVTLPNEDVNRNKNVPKSNAKCKRRLSKFFRRRVRKKESRSKFGKNTKIVSSTNQVTETSLCPFFNMVASNGNTSRNIGKEAEKNMDSHMTQISADSEKSSPQENKDQKDAMCEHPWRQTGQSVGGSKKERKVVEESQLMRQDTEVVADAVAVTAIEEDLAKICAPSVMISESKDEKTCKSIGAPVQDINDRLIKYTFRRKRKRNLNSHNESILPEKKSTVKRGTTQKSSLVIESSRDSRRLAQVARQLISLSEKRWW